MKGKEVVQGRKRKKNKNAWAWAEKKERKENGFGPVDFDWPKLKPKPIFQIVKYTRSRPNSQAQSDLGPDESKAQLKWAPATSKDGSDYDPPSPVRNS